MKLGFVLSLGAAIFLAHNRPVYGQWTASAYLGKSFSHAADVRVRETIGTDVTFRGVSFDDRSFQSPQYYGVRAGYATLGWLGIEGEFIHFKVYGRVNDAVPASGTMTGNVAPSVLVQQYNLSHGLNLLVGNVVVRRELRRKLRLGLRAGAGVAIPHAEIRAFSQAVDEYELHGAALHLSSGVEWDLRSGFYMLGEYKFTYTHPRFELGSWRIENRFATHHLVGGIGIRF